MYKYMNLLNLLRFDIVRYYLYLLFSNSQSTAPPAHTFPSAHSHSSRTTIRSSATGTTSSRHKNTRILYTPHPALSPSTSPPPTRQHHTKHPGTQSRTVLSIRVSASSSSRHPTTPLYKSPRSYSYTFPPSSVRRRLPPPIARGHYSTPRSTHPRFRRFASRLRPSNSHHHETTPGNCFRSRCFPSSRRPPPTFHSRISRCGPSQTHSSQHS